jgi:hypothetical protein
VKLATIHPTGLRTAVGRRLGRELCATMCEDATAHGMHLPPPEREGPWRLDGFDPTARRYLSFMGVDERPADWSWQARMTGSFRLKPGHSYMPYESWQYDHGPTLSRVCHMRLDLAGVLPMVGRDAYVGGHGTMDGRVLGTYRVAHGAGTEFDVSELTTLLNDAILWCPGLLTGRRTTWTDVDDRQFIVELRQGNLNVGAIVTVDAHGMPTEFTTTDRFIELPQGLVRAQWRTPVTGWITVDDHPVPTEGEAIWELDDGPFRYVDVDVDVASVRFNTPPGCATVPTASGAGVLRTG